MGYHSQRLSHIQTRFFFGMAVTGDGYDLRPRCNINEDEVDHSLFTVNNISTWALHSWRVSL